MERDKEMPLSVRLDRKAWNWLRRESERRSKATGVPVGPSTIVRAMVEREAEHAGHAEAIREFRKRLKVEKLGLTIEFFKQLRDRSPGRDVRL
jgi:hypothetical protein